MPWQLLLTASTRARRAGWPRRRTPLGSFEFLPVDRQPAPVKLLACHCRTRLAWQHDTGAGGQTNRTGASHDTHSPGRSAVRLHVSSWCWLVLLLSELSAACDTCARAGARRRSLNVSLVDLHGVASRPAMRDAAGQSSCGCRDARREARPSKVTQANAKRESRKRRKLACRRELAAKPT